MAHLHRFYVPSPEIRADRVLLPETEAHHARNVVRAKPGDAIVLFDGQGTEWTGTVAEMGKRSVEVAIVATATHPPPAYALTLVMAAIGRDKAAQAVVPRGTELGVTRFLFFRAGRSNRETQTAAKLTRAAVEACKQCGRVYLPEIAFAEDLETALEQVRGTRLIATQHAVPVALREALARASDVALFIGPEGDFTPAELDCALGAGVVPVSLGPATLRSEVAAQVFCTIVQFQLGRLG